MRFSLLCRHGLLCWSVLLLPIALQAQPTQLTGVVVDAASGLPVPFAVAEIRSRHVGVQATEQGAFSLDLPGALTVADSLRVSSLGFVARTLAVPAQMPCRLVLQPAAVALPEAVVRASAAPVVRLGPAEAGESYGFGNGRQRAQDNGGWQVARKFSEGHAGAIQSVRFYIKASAEHKQCGVAALRAPFRVRVYAADGAGGAPGTDLLTSSVLTAAAGPGWHEVDLSTFQVRAPASGFFVALEWVYTDPAFGCSRTYTVRATKEQKELYTYGPVLGGYLDDAPQAAWSLMIGAAWRQHTIAFPSKSTKGHQNAAIQALVLPD